MSQPTTQPPRNPSLLAGRLRPEDCRLADLLDSIGWRLRELDAELTRIHFVHPTPSQWLDAGSWGAA